MGAFKTLIFSFFFPFCIIANPQQILFLMHENHPYEAFSQYQEIFHGKKHDFDLLRKMAFIMLQQGSKSLDDQIRRLTIFGAGISSSSYAIDILKTGVNCREPQTQMLSLNFLSQFPEDKVTDLILNTALTSEFLPIRMEAAYFLAEKKHTAAIGIIDALMHRLPYVFKPYFPLYFALIGTPESLTILKNFLNDSNIDARIETVLAIGRFHLDDLLPFIRQKALQSSVEEQEAYASAFAQLNDSKSIPILKKMANCSFETTKLAALKALFHLGDTSAKQEIEKIANNHNLFAINILADIPGSEVCLKELLKTNNEIVKLNTALALLKRKDFSSLTHLTKFLLQDNDDIAYMPSLSPGRTLFFCKPKVVSAEKKEIRDEESYISLAYRETVLKETLELPEEYFLNIASLILDNNQTDLVPLLTVLLENHQSEKTIALLQKNTQKLGAPLIRDYCNLAMFRMNKEGSYEEYVTRWIAQSNQEEIIELFTPSSIKQKYTQYQLTPKETSRLLLEMYVALAAKQQEKSIEAIVEGIKNANTKNRYVLAGILIKALD